MELNHQYWNDRYKENATGWDLSEVSPPLKAYFDQLSDKSIAILIPGCGNSYEAEYLLSKGFTNITLVDISPLLVEKLKLKFFQSTGRISIIGDDFFNIQSQFDLIIEQTFFCALDPKLREKYVDKMHTLLKRGGKLVGLFFDKEFAVSPPFGGSKKEYEMLFSEKFQITSLQSCYNSIAPRAGTELFAIMGKK